VRHLQPEKGRCLQVKETSEVIIIKDSSSLAKIIAEIMDSKFIAIDTEFMRVDSYYPQLSLIQICSDKQAFIIDMLAEMELTPLTDLLSNTEITKVFHSARQDFEVLQNTLGIKPHPVFDTQVAWRFMGHKDNVGYDKLVQHYLNIKISKQAQYSEWLNRPLSQKQIEYAIMDVVHLHKLYQRMLEEIGEATEKFLWIVEDSSNYAHLSFDESVDMQFKKIANQIHSIQKISLCFTLIKWREQIAREQNIARSRILKNDDLLKLLARKPQSIKQLISGYKSVKNKEIAAQLVEIIHQEHDLNEQLLAMKHYSDHRRHLSQTSAVFFKIAKLLIQQTATEHEIDPGILADKKMLMHLIQDHSGPLAKGWRYELIGRDLHEFYHGNKALKHANNLLIPSSI
jgi:ribonuclease D